MTNGWLLKCNPTTCLSTAQSSHTGTTGDYFDTGLSCRPPCRNCAESTTPINLRDPPWSHPCHATVYRGAVPFLGPSVSDGRGSSTERNYRKNKFVIPLYTILLVVVLIAIPLLTVVLFATPLLIVVLIAIPLLTVVLMATILLIVSVNCNPSTNSSFNCNPTNNCSVNGNPTI